MGYRRWSHEQGILPARGAGKWSAVQVSWSLERL